MMDFLDSTHGIARTIYLFIYIRCWMLAVFDLRPASDLMMADMAHGAGMTSAERAIEDWLRARGANVETIGLDYDLIENRIIDSLHFMEFVLLLEQYTGRDILADGPTLDQFRTMRAIRDSFLASDADQAEDEVVI